MGGWRRLTAGEVLTRQEVRAGGSPRRDEKILSQTKGKV
jgi:hypothetical protein